MFDPGNKAEDTVLNQWQMRVLVEKFPKNC
jgi:hypothetical protein